MTTFPERVLIVLNPDGSFKAAAAYDVSGVPVEIDAKSLAPVLPETGALIARIDAAENERDAAISAQAQAETALAAASAQRDALQGRLDAAAKAAVISVTPFQARKALLENGLLDEVEAVIAASPRDVQLAWEYAISFERSSPLIAQLGASLGLDGATIDDLFALAATL